MTTSTPSRSSIRSFEVMHGIFNVSDFSHIIFLIRDPLECIAHVPERLKLCLADRDHTAACDEPSFLLFSEAFGYFYWIAFHKSWSAEPSSLHFSVLRISGFDLETEAALFICWIFSSFSSWFGETVQRFSVFSTRPFSRPRNTNLDSSCLDFNIWGMRTYQNITMEGSCSTILCK